MRVRVALLCLLTAAPLLGLLLLSAAINRVQSVRTAEAQAADLARLGAEQQAGMVSAAANLLRIVGQIPSIRQITPGACRDVIRTAESADPRIGSIMVADIEGFIACDRNGAPTHPSVADRAWFQQALAADPRAPPTMEVVDSRLSGRRAIVMAMPLLADIEGEPRVGVIGTAIGLEWFSNLSAQIPEHIGYAATLIDAVDGTVLARNPLDSRLTGVPPDRRLMAEIRHMPNGGAIDAPALSGHDHASARGYVYGFAPIQVGGHPLILAVGLARAEVMSLANQRLWFGTALALAAVVIAVLLAGWAAQMLLLRPIAALSAAANRFGAGDLAARAPRLRHTGELRALGLAFNRMAASLQARTRQVAAMQTELARSEEHHRLLADNVTDMISHLGPDFRRTYVSPACRDLLGYAPEQLVGHEPGGIVHPDDWIMLDATLNAPLRAGQPTARATYRALRADGQGIWLESSGRRLPGGKGYVVVTRDVSEQKAFERRLEAANRQLEDLASQDSLTGLANRRRFDEMLDTEHRRARRLRLPMAVLIADVDHFKNYNDTYGHPAGDTCLRAVAAALDGALRRPGDMAARLGGEEFVALLPNTNEDGASYMAHRIRDAVRALGILHTATETRIVTVSIGVAVTGPGTETDAAALIAAADAALYAAKRSGRDAVRLAARV